MPKRERKRKMGSLPQTNSAATSPDRMVVSIWGPGSPRKRKGPEPGALDRYGNYDRALYPELERLISKERMSLTAAARQLANEGRVSGIGTGESRARRLAKRYRAEKL
jgi:hypothetical protein